MSKLNIDDLFLLQLQAGEETAKDLGQRHGKENVAYRRIDVSSASSVQEVFDFCVETFGRVDVVVNNAGVNGESNWESMLDINFKVNKEFNIAFG